MTQVIQQIKAFVKKDQERLEQRIAALETENASFRKKEEKLNEILQKKNKFLETTKRTLDAYKREKIDLENTISALRSEGSKRKRVAVQERGLFFLCYFL